MHISKNNRETGASLIESMIAVGIISLFIAVIGTFYVAIITSQHLKYKNLAYSLAVEEVEALRNIPFSQLTNRTNSNFIETAYNVGNWSVQRVSGTPSSPNAYEIAKSSGSPTGVTGLAILPNFEYQYFSFVSKINSSADSPADWQAGIYGRYHDENNYYLVYFTATNLYLIKNVNGTPTVLNSKAKTFNTNTWYTLKFNTIGSAFEIYVNDISELTATDTSFTQGRLAIFTGNGTHSYFDDISVTTSTVESWNFDTDPISEIPILWKRYGINDLPDGAAKLTIEDAAGGSSDIKKITSRVEWNERGNLRSVEIETMITK